jgi:transposase
MVDDPVARPDDDAASASLLELVAAIDTCIERLQAARARAGHLLSARRSGSSWLDIVTAESRPLVVESVSSVLATLARAGSSWRREQAHALQAENVSINRIAALFGVTRQRISALLRERDADRLEEPSA